MRDTHGIRLSAVLLCCSATLNERVAVVVLVGERAKVQLAEHKSPSSLARRLAVCGECSRLYHRLDQFCTASTR